MTSTPKKKVPPGSSLQSGARDVKRPTGAKAPPTDEEVDDEVLEVLEEEEASPKRKASRQKDLEERFYKEELARHRKRNRKVAAVIGVVTILIVAGVFLQLTIPGTVSAITVVPQVTKDSVELGVALSLSGTQGQVSGATTLVIAKAGTEVYRTSLRIGGNYARLVLPFVDFVTTPGSYEVTATFQGKTSATERFFVSLPDSISIDGGLGEAAPGIPVQPGGQAHVNLFVLLMGPTERNASGGPDMRGPVAPVQGEALQLVITGPPGFVEVRHTIDFTLRSPSQPDPYEFIATVAGDYHVEATMTNTRVASSSAISSLSVEVDWAKLPLPCTSGTSVCPLRGPINVAPAGKLTADGGKTRVTVSLTLAGGEVDFDASGSRDGDGKVVAYHFYFDVEDASGPEVNGTSSKVTHRYSQVGDYYANVQVYDDFGAMGFSEDLKVEVVL